MKAFLVLDRRPKGFLAWPMLNAEQSPNWPEENERSRGPKAA
jgi:hypothetical protein